MITDKKMRFIHISDRCNMMRTMRRVTKRILIFCFGVLFTILYCEFLIYYVVAAQCSWPAVDRANAKEEVLKAFILADTHLLGPRRGHYLDKWRRELQMQRAFQAIVTVHRPEVVFVLGDLFDEGEWTNDKEFKEYVDRFHSLFALPDHIKMYLVPGNHDIGFHNNIKAASLERFNKLLNVSSVQYLMLKGSHFVLINSMALHGDNCHLCQDALSKIETIYSKFHCMQYPAKCEGFSSKIKYSRPIILQHFPLYRESDDVCSGDDLLPLPERREPFRPKMDSVSKPSTEYVLENLRPRLALGGHTHSGCVIRHQYFTTYSREDLRLVEYSIPSFSWRNRPDPKYMLVTITPSSYGINKCGLPKETTIVLTALVLFSLTIIYTVKRRVLARD